jgi:hypothetical protein
MYYQLSSCMYRAQPLYCCIVAVVVSLNLQRVLAKMQQVASVPHYHLPIPQGSWVSYLSILLGVSMQLASSRATLSGQTVVTISQVGCLEAARLGWLWSGWLTDGF